MKLHVGSKNKTKLTAISEVVTLYPGLFIDPEIIDVDIDIELFGHPKNMDETIQGAIDRAEKAFGDDCDFSFGLEGGLIEVPHSKTGFMEISACAIYDGREHYLGISSGFEWPTAATKMILDGECDASKAFNKLGFTTEEKLGAMNGGNLGLLTKGRMLREEQIKQSVIMALIRLERPDWY